MPSIRLIHLKLFRSYNSTIKWKGITGRKKAEKKKFGFQKWMASVIYSHQCCGRQLLLFASQFSFSFFFVSLFCSDKREFVISCINGCPFLFAIFCTILVFRFALVDMVSLTVIRLAFWRCAQLSVFEGENLLLVKLINILKKLCRHSRRQIPWSQTSYPGIYLLFNRKYAGKFNLACGFSKIVSSKEREKPCFFVT